MLLRKTDPFALRFSKFKNSSWIFMEPQLTQLSFNFKTCWNLKAIGVFAIVCVWPFYHFDFERNYNVLNSNSLCFLLNKNINYNQNKMESHIHFWRAESLCFSSYKNRNLKLKLCWFAALKKRRHFYGLFKVPLFGRKFCQHLFYFDVWCI